MANTLLTPTAVTREVLRVAHEKLAFIGTVERQYDSSFAKSGAKIGDSLSIRQPNKYTVRTGATLSAQDTEESSTTLTVATQKGVDMNFTSQDLTMDLDDFSKRIIEPAASVLVSNIEGAMLADVTKYVYNHVGTPGTLPTFAQITKAKAKLNQMLAPKDNNRCIQMESIDMAGQVDALKGLFQDSTQISKQYREGVVGRASGLNWVENERIYTHANSSDVTGITINADVTNGDTSFTITGASAAPTVGSIFTCDATYAVHPETKVAYAHLQQFVVTDLTTPSTTVISIEPVPYESGAKQNVDALPTSTDALVFVGAASTNYPNHLVYHKEAFAFASADLVMPEGVDFAARENYDGLSIRLVRAYDINTDKFPCRLDILHGWKALRPEWAARIMGSGA
jgi:hypothetical protein